MKSDQQLIDAINEGRLDAFESLYLRYRDWVYNLAWRLTANQQDALDVLQETYLYVLGKFPGFTLTSSMTTFLYPVVKHISLNIVRKNRRFVSEQETLAQTINTKSGSENTKHAELEVVLNVLSDDLREIVLMRYVDDMSQEEISTALNTPLGTIKSRLHRALQTLRQDERTQSYFLE